MHTQFVLVSFLHVCFFLLATLLLGITVSTLTQLLGRRFAKTAPHDHWTTQARQKFPIKRIRLFNLLFLLVLIPFLGQKLFGKNLILPDHLTAVLGAASAFWGLRLGTRIFEKKSALKKRPLVTFATYSIVVAFNILIFFVFAMFMPKAWGVTGGIWILGVIAVSYAGIKGLGIKIGQWLQLVLPPTPELENMVAGLSQALHLEGVQVWIAKSDSPNAFAYPWLKTIVCTDALLTALEPAEVKAVCAHELGHVSEGKTVVRRRLAMIWLFSLLLIAIYLFNVFALSPWITLAATWLVALVILFGSRKFARKQEMRADEVAHKHDHLSDYDGLGPEGEVGVYARALEKIYRLNEIPAVLSKRQAHPSLYDRMLAAGVTPDFDRPEKPSAVLLWGGMTANIMLVIALCTAWLVSARLIAEPDSSSRVGSKRSIMTKMVLGGAKPMDLTALGWAAIYERDFRAADEWFDQATKISPLDYQIFASAAYGYSSAGNCDKAEKHWSKAKALFEEKKNDVDETDRQWFHDVEAVVAFCGETEEALP